MVDRVDGEGVLARDDAGVLDRADEAAVLDRIVEKGVLDRVVEVRSVVHRVDETAVRVCATGLRDDVPGARDVLALRDGVLGLGVVQARSGVPRLEVDLDELGVGERSASSRVRECTGDTLCVRVGDTL